MRHRHPCSLCERQRCDRPLACFGSPRAELLASACFLGLIFWIGLCDENHRGRQGHATMHHAELPTNRPPGNSAEEHEGWSEEVIQSIVDEKLSKIRRNSSRGFCSPCTTQPSLRHNRRILRRKLLQRHQRPTIPLDMSFELSNDKLSISCPS